jgi:RNA polymerase sigma factor (sigma-70 family)
MAYCTVTPHVLEPLRQVPADVTSQQRDLLYSRFNPLIRRLVRKYADLPEVREDLAGELYCCFCNLVRDYEPERGIPLRPYLVRHLTAFAYTYARRGWTRRGREVHMDVSNQFFHFLNPMGDAEEWTDRLAKEQLLDSLPYAIARLPRQQRRAIIWRYYGNLSYEEIARRLEVEVTTARSQVRHAITNLKLWVSNEGLEA